MTCEEQIAKDVKIYIESEEESQTIETCAKINSGFAEICVEITQEYEVKVLQLSQRQRNSYWFDDDGPTEKELTKRDCKIISFEQFDHNQKQVKQTIDLNILKQLINNI